MEKYLKIKINGFNIKSLFLILYLSKYNHEFYIDDSIKFGSKYNFNNKFYTITKTTKIILQELNLWEKLEKNISSFNSFSLYNNYFKEEILFSNKHSYSNHHIKENFGWIINHSYLEEVLFNQLSNNKNIYYLKNENSDVSKRKFDYEFYFESFNNKYLKNNNILPFNKIGSPTALIFKVMVRENSLSRAYEIFLKKGSILMIPLSKNIYQIIWKFNFKKAKDLMNINVNLLLDNLSTVLPKGLKLDQIIGEVYFSSNTLQLLNNVSFKRDKIYFNDFNNVSNHPLKDELKSLLVDLNTIQKKFSTIKNFDKYSFARLKNKFYIKGLLNFSNKLFLKNMIFRVFIGSKFFPYLFIKSPLLRLNNKNPIKKAINLISTSIFQILIR